MKKIKAQKKQEENLQTTLTPEKRTRIACIAGAILLLFIVLVIVESAGRGKIVIENNTSRKITSIKTYFKSYEEEYVSDNIADIELAAGKTFKDTLPDLSDLKGTASGLIFEITFENEEVITIDTGYFNTKFDGKIKAVFNEDDLSEVTMKVKASTGLFGSTANTMCNETYEMHLLDKE